MNKFAIEQSVRTVHKKVWGQRVALGIDAGPYIAMLHPSLGAAALGVRFEIDDHLDREGIAGLIDRGNGRIAIARRYPFITQRFTGAHELGHLVLHSGLVMHRDGPIVGTSLNYPKRDPEEQEADYFAACYLMPEKLVKEEFEKRFGTRKPFPLNDNVAYMLSPNDPNAFFNGSPRERGAILAAATRYNRVSIEPLCGHFSVSIQSMAIRLVELGLV